jgi:hypothetical protein
MYEALSAIDILLDEENPRFAEPVGSQAEAINALLALGAEKLINLARDIALLGELDPTNPPIVWRSGKKLVVLEGNRRMAALKLLRKPDLAKATATRSAIERIRKDATAAGLDPNGPSRVTAWVVKDRSAPRHWVELRHTGQNEGVGTDPWNSYQSITFRRRPGTPLDQAWLLVRAILATFSDDTALVADVRRVRDEKFTNLGRLLGRAPVVEAFGWAFDGDSVTLRPEDPYYVDIIRTVFADLVDMSVDDIKTAKLQDEYSKRVVDAVRLSYPEGPTPPPGGDVGDGAAKGPGGGGSRTGTRGDGSDPTAGTENGSATGTKGGGGSRPEPRIFYTLSFKRLSGRTSRVLKDAQKVKIDDAVSVCAVMVRVILELVVTEIGVPRGWFKEGETLRKKVRKALLMVDPNCDNSKLRSKDLEMAWILSQADTEAGGLGIDEMNAYVHNFLAEPTADRVRGLSRAFRPLLTKLDALVGAEGETT